MSAKIDIAAYFQRIGLIGETPATLATLKHIVALHGAAIAFENLSPLCQEPVPLDMPSLERKLIHEGRGGYCFEQNLLLRNVLLQLGYSVTGLAARVKWNAPTLTARSHMLLRIDFDDDAYLVDVGFGGVTLTDALRLQTDVAQKTPHEPFRLLSAEDQYLLQVKFGGEWRDVYSFDLQPQLPIDYEPINWYLSTNPASHFTQRLMAARVLADRRYALRDNIFTIRLLTGQSEQRTLTTADELRTVLEKEFAIAVPHTPRVQATFARLASS